MKLFLFLCNVEPFQFNIYLLFTDSHFHSHFGRLFILWTLIFKWCTFAVLHISTKTHILSPHHNIWFYLIRLHYLTTTLSTLCCIVGLAGSVSLCISSGFIRVVGHLSKIVFSAFTFTGWIQNNDSHVKSHILFRVNVILIRSYKNEKWAWKPTNESQFIISHINSGWSLDMIIIVLQLNDNLT